MTPVERIAKVIAEHVRVVTDPHLSRCRCGWEVPIRHSGTQRHQKHQATMIAHMILDIPEKKK